MRTFQNRKLNNMLVTMVARHRHLTATKRIDAETSWALEGAELVTDSVAGLRTQLQPVRGERLVGLKGIGEMPSDVPD